MLRVRRASSVASILSLCATRIPRSARVYATTSDKKTMARPSRDSVLMQSAWVWSQRSTCSRLQVGAVFARDGRILVTGYNGAPTRLRHCIHLDDSPCTTAEHAERNGIAYAARHGITLQGSTLYVTHMPCSACAMSIINAGVTRVLYQEPYRDRSGVKLMMKASLVVERYTPS